MYCLFIYVSKYIFFKDPHCKTWSELTDVSEFEFTELPTGSPGKLLTL